MLAESPRGQSSDCSFSGTSLPSFTSVVCADSCFSLPLPLATSKCPPLRRLLTTLPWLQLQRGGSVRILPPTPRPQQPPFQLGLLLGPMSISKFKSSFWGPESGGGKPRSGGPPFYSPLLPPRKRKLREGGPAPPAAKLTLPALLALAASGRCWTT